MQIRPFEPADTEAVRRMLDTAFGRETEHLIVTALRAADADTLELVADSDGQIVGGIMFSPATGRTADGEEVFGLALGPVAVLPDFERRGIGSALLRRGIAELERPHRRPPPSEIQLHVDPERTEARRLYEAFGFQRAALLAGYYSDNRDALLMRRVNAALSPTKQ